MPEQTAERSPRTKASIAGIFYLLTIVIGALALFVRDSLRSVLLLGSTGCYIVVTVLLYGLFRPVSRNISAIAALFSFAGCAVSTVDQFHPGLFGLNPLMFFGGYCLLLGYLIFESSFLPRILGALMAVGGLGWLTFAWPAWSGHLLPYNMAPGVLGESALTLWLLTMGINARRWHEQARAGA